MHEAKNEKAEGKQDFEIEKKTKVKVQQQKGKLEKEVTEPLGKVSRFCCPWLPNEEVSDAIGINLYLDLST